MLTINDFKPRDPEEGHHPEEERFHNRWPMCICYEALWEIHEKLGPDYISQIVFNTMPNELSGSLNIEWYQKGPDGVNRLVSRGYLPGQSQHAVTHITTIHKSLRYFGQLSYRDCGRTYRDYSIPADMRKSVSAYRLVFDCETWSAQETAYVCTPEKVCRNI